MGMTKKEAAKRLREIGVKFALFSLRGTEELSLNAEALNMAIEELKRESCNDCISRQAAIDTIESWLSCDEYNEAERNIMRAAQSVLYALPPVIPQPKIGRWINDENMTNWYDATYKCSCCGREIIIPYESRNDLYKNYPYCHCGTKMTENKAEEFDNLEEMLEKLWNDTEGDEKRMNIKLDKGAFEPIREHKTDAGLDLRTPEEFVIKPNDSYIIDTGVHIELPKGYYGKLESKSGLNVKHNIVCLGGTIDEPYRGSIVVKLYNVGKEEYHFNKGDKIVQLVIQPYLAPDIEYTDKLSETDRGDNGFGSTGK